MATSPANKRPAAPKEDDNEFSFRELLLKSLNYLPLFAIFLGLSFIIALTYIHFQTALYSSSIKLLIKNVQESSSESDQVLQGILSPAKPNLNNEMEVVKSQKLMEKVVLRQQLNTVYYSIGKVNTVELFNTNLQSKFVVFSAIKDSGRSYNITIRIKADGSIYVLSAGNELKTQNHKLVITPLFNYVINIPDISFYNPEYSYSATWLPTATVAGGLAGSLNVSPLNKYSTIILISTTAQVPLKSEVVLNSLVDEYNNYNIEQNNVTAENTIRFIDDRLLFISGELNKVENGLKNFKQNNALDISAQGAQEVGKAKTLEDKLDEQELQVNVANMVSQYINNPKRRYELVPSNLGIGDGTLGGLIGSYNAGVLKRDELLKTLGEKNLQIISLESQLDDFRNKIMESINNLKALYNNAYSTASSEYQKTLANIKTIPEKEKQLLEIERQQGIKEKLYLYLLEKREEYAISRAGSTGKSESVDVAKSYGPINLKNSNIYLMALFAGLGIPLLIVYLMDLLNDRVTTREEVLKFTDAPIIGEITHFGGQERKIVAAKTRGILPEQFRIVRTNLRYFLPKDIPGACLLITSTMPGEGKTFISMNLAAVLAVSGKRTVIIEFDMRRPKISESLKIAEAEVDLPAFLAGGSSPEKIISRVEGMDNLFAITTSVLPPNPAELLLSPQIAVLFSYLKKHFDYIIIDTPPLGIVSDAKVLSEYADLSIYIVRQRFTQRKQLKMLNDIYHEKRLPNLALVVNDVKLKGIRSYYGYGYTYGGSYGYDYSLGYGYSDGDRRKRPLWRRLFRRKRR